MNIYKTKQITLILTSLNLLLGPEHRRWEALLKLYWLLLGPEHRMVRGPIEIVRILIIIIQAKEGAFWGL